MDLFRSMAAYCLLEVAKQRRLPRPDVAAHLRRLPGVCLDGRLDATSGGMLVSGEFLSGWHGRGHITIYYNTQKACWVESAERLLVHELTHWAEWRLTGHNAGYPRFGTPAYSWSRRHAEDLARTVEWRWDPRGSGVSDLSWWRSLCSGREWVTLS